MLRIAFQQCKLLVRAISYLERQRLVGSPKTFRGAVFHYLKRTDSSVLLIVQRALHGRVQPALFQLLLRQRPNHPRNLFYLFCAHIPRPFTMTAHLSSFCHFEASLDVAPPARRLVLTAACRHAS